MVITPDAFQRRLIEYGLLWAASALLWKNRKIEFINSITAQYGALAITHVLFSELARLITDEAEVGSEQPLFIAERLGFIGCGIATSIGVTYLLSKKVSWLKADTQAFTEVIAASYFAVVAVDLIFEEPEIDKSHKPYKV
ncbi:MAG: hypothetical protein AAGE99_06075 [Chlamydiota bacterium]